MPSVKSGTRKTAVGAEKASVGAVEGEQTSEGRQFRRVVVSDAASAYHGQVPKQITAPAKAGLIALILCGCASSTALHQSPSSAQVHEAAVPQSSPHANTEALTYSNCEEQQLWVNLSYSEYAGQVPSGFELWTEDEGATTPSFVYAWQCRLDERVVQEVFQVVWLHAQPGHALAGVAPKDHQMVIRGYTNDPGAHRVWSDWCFQDRVELAEIGYATNEGSEDMVEGGFSAVGPEPFIAGTTRGEPGKAFENEGFRGVFVAVRDNRIVGSAALSTSELTIVPGNGEVSFDGGPAIEASRGGHFHGVGKAPYEMRFESMTSCASGD